MFITVFVLIILGLSPPVGDNTTMEINSCTLNYMWSPPLHTGCPLTMYIIYYREIQSEGNKADWLQIPITQVKKTSYVIPLKCDIEYEIAVSVKDEQRESVISNFWRVKTKSPATDVPSNSFFLGEFLCVPSPLLKWKSQMPFDLPLNLTTAGSPQKTQ